MSRFINIISKFFGNKYDKDIKAVQPIIDEIHKEHSLLSEISNDDLREKTVLFKKEISIYTNEEKNKIRNLKESIEKKEVSADEKENIYKKIDELNSLILEKTEECLKNILPKAFAVIKETANRFSKNTIIEVTANDTDKELATKKDFVEIKNDKALYHNSWNAAGANIKWNMIHYDVQLIGGIILHEGKIAEMQTGEGKTLSATLPIYLNAPH